MLSLVGWGCGLRCFPLTRRWLLNYWPRSWSWALIMPQLICSAEYDRTIAIWQTQSQPVRAFPTSLLITNRWCYLFSKILHLFSRGGGFVHCIYLIELISPFFFSSLSCKHLGVKLSRQITWRHLVEPLQVFSLGLCSRQSAPSLQTGGCIAAGEGQRQPLQTRQCVPQFGRVCR
jgi:hypothetical protein